MKYLADTNEQGQKTLLYASRNLEETAFIDEIEVWKSGDPDLTVINSFAQPPEGWTGPTGLITPEMIQRFIPDLDNQLFFVTGPPAMVECVVDCLNQLDVPKERVTLEELTGYERMV